MNLGAHHHTRLSYPRLRTKGIADVSAPLSAPVTHPAELPVHTVCPTPSKCQAAVGPSLLANHSPRSWEGRSFRFRLPAKCARRHSQPQFPGPRTPGYWTTTYPLRPSTTDPAISARRCWKPTRTSVTSRVSTVLVAERSVTGCPTAATPEVVYSLAAPTSHETTRPFLS